MKLKINILIVLFLVINNNSSAESNFSLNNGSILLNSLFIYTPQFIHHSETINSNGYSLGIIYPGFYTTMPEINIFYKTKKSQIFHIGFVK